MSDKQSTKPTELVDDPEDPELSELLDSALADFSKPVPGAVPTAAPAANNTAAAPAEQSDAGPTQQEGIKDAYKAFEEAMKQALEAGPDSAAGAGGGDATFSALMTSLTEEMAKTEVEGADDPLAKTLADLSKNLSSDAEKSVGAEPDMAELLKAFSGSGDAPDAASLDAFMPLMQTVMSSILSKDVLYPSLKDVAGRYPAWLEANGGSLSTEQRDRYTRQHQLMVQVCRVFEEEGEVGSAEGGASRQERVFALMQQMQALGQPPEELVGQSELGLAFDGEGNPRLPAGLGAASGAECVLM